jgi:hypothetical protein
VHVAAGYVGAGGVVSARAVAGEVNHGWGAGRGSRHGEKSKEQ